MSQAIHDLKKNTIEEINHLLGDSLSPHTEWVMLAKLPLGDLLRILKEIKDHQQELNKGIG